MTTFDIYTKNNSDNEAVKQGWSWPAYLSPSIWALFMRFWFLGLSLFTISWIWFIATVIIYTAYKSSSAGNAQLFYTLYFYLGTSGPVGIGIGLTIRQVFGTYGNNWKRKHLIRTGYELAATLNAPSKTAALASYERSNTPKKITYRIVLKGMKDGSNKELVIFKLSQLLGASESDVHQLLAANGVAIKKGLDLQSVEKYQVALEATGAATLVESENAEVLKFDLPQSILQASQPAVVNLNRPKKNGINERPDSAKDAFLLSGSIFLVLAIIVILLMVLTTR